LNLPDGSLRGATERRASGATLCALLALTLACAGLRLAHIDSGLPQAVEADLKLPDSLISVREGRGGAPRAGEKLWYPILPARVAALFPVSEQPGPDAALEQHLAKAAEPVLHVRLAVALLASLIVPLSFLLARTTLRDGPALVAAGLAGTSLLHVAFSQQARPHAVAAATFLAAVLGAIAVRRRGDLTAWLAAGAGCALAIGTLQSCVFVLPPLALAWFLRARAGGRWLELRTLPALALMALAVPYFFPEVRGEEVARLDGARQAANVGGHLLYFEQFRGGGLRVFLRTTFGFDPWLGLWAAAGTALALGALRRARALGDTTAIALAFALPYLAVLCAYDRSYERFFAPIVPYLAWAAGFAVQRASDRLALARRPAAGWLLGALVLAPPAAADWAWLRVRAGPHPTQRCADWISEHVPEHDTPIVITPLTDLPLVRRPEGLEFGKVDIYSVFNVPWSRYQSERGVAALPQPPRNLAWLRVDGPALERLLADPWGHARASGARLMVIEVFDADRTPVAFKLLREELRQRSRLLARFSPDRDPQRWGYPFDPQEPTVPHPPWFLPRMLRAESTGPILEVYDVECAPDGESPFHR
jgi:hypothetical protein